MNRYAWKNLNNQQVGAFVEYFVKMELTMFGFQVYSTEVDDRGIDFIARHKEGQFLEIQVKSLRGMGYVFVQKEKFRIKDNMLLALGLLEEGKPPELFLIPSTAWKTASAGMDSTFVGRDYDGLKSKPEWGINVSRKNLPDLEQYRFEKTVAAVLDLNPTRTIRYGSKEVEVIEPSWERADRVPLKKTYSLKPGQSWFDAEETPKQWENYVRREDGLLIPVGAAVAKELKSEGAVEAAFVELWGGCVLVDENLTCLDHNCLIGNFIEQVRFLNQGKLGGFPDVIGIFADGRIALREIKCKASKDRLNRNQHYMADLLYANFPTIDLKVVKW